MQLLLFWTIDGLVAGWLTGKVMSAGGRDLWMDAIMGTVGGVAAGFIVNVSGFLVNGRMIYTNLAAALGAALLTVFARFVAGRREYAATN
jgi:uncharacterized membrane protein YeaQ/YmgE (transglycosylase-associated protein family)